MTAATTPESTIAPQKAIPPILLKRPCVLVAAFLIPGIIVGHCLFPRAMTIWLFVPLLALLLVAILLSRVHSTFSTAATMFVVFWVGVLLGVKTGLLPPNHVYFKLKAETPYELRATVVDEPVQRSSRSFWRLGSSSDEKENGRCSFVVKATDAREMQSKNGPWEALTGKILVYASGEKAQRLRYGDKLELTGTAFLPEPRRNPGSFDARKYYAQNGIYVCMRADEIHGVEHGHGNFLYRGLHSLKRKLRDSLSAGRVGEQEKAFLFAVILGERSELDEDFKEALRRTNTMHILAISGLNVAILASVIYLFLTRLLFLPREISSLLTVAFLFPYTVLTGMAPPVVRSSLMCAALLLGPLLKRRHDSINSIAFAAVGIVLFRPSDLFTASFQLSFLVVLSMLLLSDKIFRGLVLFLHLRPDPGFLVVSPSRRWAYRHIFEPPLRAFSVSLASFLGSLPLVLHYFHSVSLLSPIWNVPVVLLVGFIVPLGSIAAVVGLAARSLAGIMNTVNGVLVYLLEGAVTFFSSVRPGTFNVSPPGPVFIFAFYGLIVLVGFTRSFRRMAIPIALTAVLTTGLFVGAELLRRHPNSVEITFLDVGQGDCIFVEFPDGRKMLVDGGSISRSDVGRYVIVPFLRWAGVNRLDAIVITHYDEDHTNGLAPVLDDIGARKVLARAVAEPSEPANALFAAAKTRAVWQSTVRAGRKLLVSGRVSVEVLSPSPEGDSSQASENDLSIVLKLAFRGSSILLCGDIERTVEASLLRQVKPVRSDVLKVPHHGSSSSSSEEFVGEVAPTVAVISCGKRNIYRHPSSDVLERYERVGARIYRTDRDGGIVVRVFKDRLSVTTTL
jgi:competence protein ComEC